MDLLPPDYCQAERSQKDTEDPPPCVCPRSHCTSGLRTIADLLNTGAVCGVPTDTVYALAASCKHPQAIEKVYRIKVWTQSCCLVTWILYMSYRWVMYRSRNGNPLLQVVLSLRVWPWIEFMSSHTKMSWTTFWAGQCVVEHLLLWAWGTGNLMVPSCFMGGQSTNPNRYGPNTCRKWVQTHICALSYEVLNQNPWYKFPQTFGDIQGWSQTQSLHLQYNFCSLVSSVLHEAISWLAWRNKHNRLSQLALSVNISNKGSLFCPALVPMLTFPVDEII